ncbi:ABC transporter ATP-binding protein [Brachybacterium sp.]|uniref:ABC transporter ATP-binding protein n=1 Tax=Brachybacterium sp. TaxID=1891286 RepID=UPI0034621FD7
MSFGSVVALSRTTLHVAPGESIAIMGPSGSGKTTLLRVLQGLTPPSSGYAVVLGQNQGTARKRERAELRRRRMGLISQNADLLPEFSALENVALPLLLDGARRSEGLEAGRRALHRLGLGERCDAHVASLSGGEAQRVAVARAIVREDVELVIADEPTASLDVENAQAVTSDLLKHAADRRAALVLATHDPHVAKRCDRIVRISRGMEA